MLYDLVVVLVVIVCYIQLLNVIILFEP
jgi:hypothetical protein